MIGLMDEWIDREIADPAINIVALCFRLFITLHEY
jgi:hypothetical protein